MSKLFIVTGLPRSGTSVTAGVLRIVGAEFGEVDELYAPAHPTGIIEDLDLMNIDIAAMGDSKTHLFDPSILPNNAVYEQKLRDLVAQKSKGKKIYAFKSTRAPWLFEMYQKALPHAKYVVTKRDREDWLDAIHRYAPTLERERAERMYDDYQTIPITGLYVHIDDIRSDPIDVAENMATYLGTKLTKEKKKAIEKFVIKKE